MLKLIGALTAKRLATVDIQPEYDVVTPSTQPAGTPVTP
jgi:hypothetical protein